MELTALEHRTDLIFWSRFGDVIDRDDHVIVSTPKRRGWYWGNLLILPSGPRAGDLGRWETLFDRELGADPKVLHRLFAWHRRDGDDEQVAPFVDRGYAFEESLVLATASVHAPPRPNREIAVRAIRSDEEWEQVIENQVASRNERFAIATYAPFVRHRIAEYRRLIDEGIGQWYGAFLGGRVVGDLGLFRSGTLARFQIVATSPGYRRRGICGTLVATVAQHALDEGVEQLVMVADEHDVAARVYRSVGFQPVERSAGLILYPSDER